MRSNLNTRINLARKTGKFIDVPAPRGGLNTRDPLQEMPITDAFRLENWVPQANGLTSRKGYVVATENYSSYPETIIHYLSGVTSQIITASGSVLYTDDGEDTLTSIATGLSNARWRGTQLGSNLILVNGADAPRNWDGTTITTPSFSGDLSTYGTTNIDGIHKHKNRVYMWDTSYPNFFYGGVNSISGAFTEFNLENVSDTAGNIIEIKTISRDAGDGPDDYIAFILSTGEVLIYQGSDPGDANSWALVGKYKIPPIIAKNCATEFAGDILIATKADIVKLSDVINYSGESGGFNLKPSKLSGAIRDNFNLYGSNYGWQLLTYPTEGWIILNVPLTTNSTYRQFILNTVTGGATQFTNWNGSVFGVVNEKLYFGADTTLYNANSSKSDNGSGIPLVGSQAFSNFGTPSRKKPNNAKLFLLTEGQVSAELAIAYDFEAAKFNAVQESSTSTAIWNTAKWDQAFWAGKTAVNIRYTLSGLGVYVSPKVSLTTTNQEITWNTITYNFNVAENF